MSILCLNWVVQIVFTDIRSIDYVSESCKLPEIQGKPQIAEVKRTRYKQVYPRCDGEVIS